MADGAAHLALGPIGLAFGLEVAVAGHLTGLFLNGAGRLFETALHPLLIHFSAPNIPSPSSRTKRGSARFRNKDHSSSGNNQSRETEHQRNSLRYFNGALVAVFVRGE